MPATAVKYFPLPDARRGSKGRRPKQLELRLGARWGGRRPGAGRKAAAGRRAVLHRARAAHRAAHPVHVTLRAKCRSLRTQFVFPTLRGAIADANRRAPERFRIVEFSVQGDHVHLIVEATERSALIEGVRGLCIRIARRVNKLISRRGRFFADRWHGRALESPRAVRNVLVYVLGNFSKHGRAGTALLDRYSSAPYFRDFREFASIAPYDKQPTPRNSLAPPRDSAEMPVVRAKTWLLRSGWKRHGKLSIFERPRN